MNHNPLSPANRILRDASALVGLLACVVLLWMAARAGVSRISSAYAANARQLDGADRATRLAPNDPHAHLIRGALLKRSNRFDEAIKEYQQAIALRPRDYVLWLELGLALDEAEESEQAVNALKETVVRAPYYAGPRWHLGNVLLRAGRVDEAFAEMRLAAQSNPIFLSPAIDLAWSIYGGNVSSVEQAIQPQGPMARLSFARFAAKRGKADDAVRIFRQIENVPEAERRGLLNDLLTAKHFVPAYQVWLTAPGNSDRGFDKGLTDGGFEQQIKLDEPGFGWQISRNVRSVRTAFDQVQPQSGKRSLKIDWSGDSEPASEIFSQIVVVEPNTRYRLTFSARTEDLVTGGLPQIVIMDAGAKDPMQLAQSEPLSQKTSPWKESVVEFTTGKETQAIIVLLRRQNCTTGPCPVFGRVWLDDFALAKV